MKKSREVVELLKKYPVFNLNCLVNILKKKRSYAKLFLYRLKKNGFVFEIEKNKYTVYKDIFIISSRIVWPSYISFWSALRYYNLTEQMPQDVWVLTTRKRKKNIIKFMDKNIIFINTKPKYFFGYEKTILNGFEIFIAEPEKAIIDSILFKKISFSEIIDILKTNLKKINTKKLCKFALKTKNKATIKRLGFLLEKLGIDCYEKFKKNIYPVYTKLEFCLEAKGRKNEKWKIIENVKVQK